MDVIARLFRRSKPDRLLADREALADFLESRAAFVSQKCVYEYCRARSGINWSKLMIEPAFLEAIEVSRWEAFAAALEDLTVLLEGLLRPQDPATAARLADALTAIAAEVLARHPVPAHRPQGWDEELAGLRQRLARLQLIAPQTAAEIAKTGGTRIYEGLPFDRSATKHDRELVTNAVRFNFCRIADDLMPLLRRAELTGSLLADASLPPPRPIADGEA